MWDGRTECLPRSSLEREEDMILRRTEDGAEKCALRDLRRELDVSSHYRQHFARYSTPSQSFRPEVHPSIRSCIQPLPTALFPPQSTDVRQTGIVTAWIRTGVELHLEEAGDEEREVGDGFGGEDSAGAPIACDFSARTSGRECGLQVRPTPFLLPPRQHACRL